MIFLLFIIISVGIMGAIAFLNIDKVSQTELKNEAEEYEITEIY